MCVLCWLWGLITLASNRGAEFPPDECHIKNVRRVILRSLQRVAKERRGSAEWRAVGVEGGVKKKSRCFLEEIPGLKECEILQVARELPCWGKPHCWSVSNFSRFSHSLAPFQIQIALLAWPSMYGIAKARCITHNWGGIQILHT